MLIEKIKINNLLSFGPDSNEIELGPLNVLIGPNGSGKSNFIDAISLLNWAPKNIPLAKFIKGGVQEWFREKEQPISIDTTISVGYLAVRYRVRIAKENIFIHLNELITESSSEEIIYDFPEDSKKYKIEQKNTMVEKNVSENNFDTSKSILSQYKTPEVFAKIPAISFAFERISLFREWSVGRSSVPRLPQRADLPNSVLEEDGSNLGLVMNKICEDIGAKRKILESLNNIYPNIDDINVSIDSGSVQLFLIENGKKIPATRLSDGTLRYLYLLAILMLPEKASLICIEEPELGLHPDVLPTIAELLKQASEKTQLIVTTHSDILVDALTDTPESILVCDKVNGSTVMKRLEADKLKVWLKDYSLGNLWTSGQIGGTRW